jgi:hypothetical protein
MRPRTAFRLSRAMRSRVAWLALLAMCLQALWPLATAARPATDAASGICSASGFRLTTNMPVKPPLHKLACLQCGLCASPLAHTPAPSTPLLLAGARCAPAWRFDADDTASVGTALRRPGARPRAPPPLLRM